MGGVGTRSEDAYRGYIGGYYIRIYRDDGKNWNYRNYRD